MMMTALELMVLRGGSAFALGASLSFCVQYTAFARWWRNAPGSTFFAAALVGGFTLGIPVLLTTATVRWSWVAWAWPAFPWACGMIMLARQFVFMHEHRTWKPGWHEPGPAPTASAPVPPAD